jgi:S-adenosylmethionine hydrolase
VDAVEISGSPRRLEPVSATFHGRDIFAPVAARLSAGERLQAAGEPLEPGALSRLILSRARQDSGGNRVTHVVDIDGFGNVALDAAEHQDVVGIGWEVGARVRLTSLDRVHGAVFALGFVHAKPGELMVYEDSGGALALALNSGNASEMLGLRLGEPLTLAP